MNILNLTKKEIPSSRSIELIKEKEFPSDYVVLDFETTGLSPIANEIIQVAAIRYRNYEKVSEFMSFVYTTTIPEKITELTSITLDQCQCAPRIKSVLIGLIEFIGNDIIVAHNATFDLDFLIAKMKRHCISGKTFAYVDTLRLARKKSKGVLTINDPP